MRQCSDLVRSASVRRSHLRSCHLAHRLPILGKANVLRRMRKAHRGQIALMRLRPGTLPFTVITRSLSIIAFSRRRSSTCQREYLLALPTGHGAPRSRHRQRERQPISSTRHSNQHECISTLCLDAILAGAAHLARRYYHLVALPQCAQISYPAITSSTRFVHHLWDGIATWPAPRSRAPCRAGRSRRRPAPARRLTHRERRSPRCSRTTGSGGSR